VPLRVFFKARAEGVRKTLTVLVNVTREPVLLPLISPRVRVPAPEAHVASHTSHSPGVLLSIAIVNGTPTHTD
jgi:hypothetical protein